MKVSGQLHAPVALPPGKQLLAATGKEFGWAPEPVWTRWWREKFPVPAETRTLDHPAHSPALYHWVSVNILSDNKNSIQENTEKVLDTDTVACLKDIILKCIVCLSVTLTDPDVHLLQTETRRCKVTLHMYRRHETQNCFPYTALNIRHIEVCFKLNL
jgi:hypothetical protein